MITFETPKQKAYLYMHLSIILWGMTGVLGRGIQLQEGLLVWYRMLITVISMFAYILYSGQSLKIGSRDLLKLVWIGTLLTIHWLFFYGSIKYSNVSITLTMLASQGLFTALMEPLVTGKKFRWDELFFSITAMIGIWLIFAVEEVYTIGIILGLLASFVGAFFNILNKDMVSRHSPVVVSFYEIASGLLVLTLFLPFYIHYFHPVRLVPDHMDWVLLLILAILCTHVTLVLSLAALRELSAFTLNLSINLEPVYGIALAFLIFHENKQLHRGFFIGAGIIMLSVLVEAYFQSRKSPKDSAA
jgi:drug/metabolite transporter (DMT)-like permease